MNVLPYTFIFRIQNCTLVSVITERYIYWIFGIYTNLTFKIYVQWGSLSSIKVNYFNVLLSLSWTRFFHNNFAVTCDIVMAFTFIYSWLFSFRCSQFTFLQNKIPRSEKLTRGVFFTLNFVLAELHNSQHFCLLKVFKEWCQSISLEGH